MREARPVGGGLGGGGPGSGGLGGGGDTFEVEGDVGENGGKSGGLRAQVSINGNKAPAADEFDGVFVDSAAKEGARYFILTCKTSKLLKI